MKEKKKEKKKKKDFTIAVLSKAPRHKPLLLSEDIFFVEGKKIKDEKDWLVGWLCICADACCVYSRNAVYVSR